MLFAQRDLSTPAGTVMDPTGGVIVAATVTITEVDTGLVYTLTTSGSGEFVRPALKPSTYSVSVKAAGFKAAEQFAPQPPAATPRLRKSKSPDSSAPADR
jgi:hypothetical protein